MSARQTDLLQEEIRKMLKYQVTEIGEPDYASPMILAETPERDPMPCINYKKLNEISLTPKAQYLAAFTTSFWENCPLRCHLGKNGPHYFSKLMAEHFKEFSSILRNTYRKDSLGWRRRYSGYDRYDSIDSLAWTTMHYG
ncbi:hypothetical protein TNIN_461421 [Trichonephila inaurata madagascariensis]|uniref:Uncharacterized protein n=1 Tax=Trichonephila inaurata madagascariensis TaxID=2747483 RepID=A0A8X7C3K5_9ARAC|nr:hypothetical protein TNIN_461421 [Trichonephila inaurata madagascariensis]